MTRRATIAPNLTELVEAYASIKTVSGRNERGAALRRELRALKSVARAAQRFRAMFTPTAEFHKLPLLDLDRALGRLSRSSGGKTK